MSPLRWHRGGTHVDFGDVAWSVAGSVSGEDRALEFEKTSVWTFIGGALSAATRVSWMGFALFVLTSGEAEAHHLRRPADSSGVSIPSMTHGQLRVMSGYRSAVLDLARRQARPDLEARTLHNFIELQFAYCLWGLVPGSLSHEGNPFNECSHAYLAGTKALLDRLRRAEDTRSEAEVLAETINREMVLDGSALEICSNSFEAFNTAEIIMPEWANVSFNPLGVLLGIVVMGAGAAAFGVARRGRMPSAVGQPRPH